MYAVVRKETHPLLGGTRAPSSGKTTYGMAFFEKSVENIFLLLYRPLKQFAS